MRIIRALVCILYVTVIAATASAQQDVGDPRAGHELAAERCASCHAIGPDTPESPVERATRFEVIANTPGMSERALTVRMTTSHPHRTMPHLILNPGELSDVIAYIRSLRQKY